jgi:hypothetical protein
VLTLPCVKEHPSVSTTAMSHGRGSGSSGWCKIINANRTLQWTRHGATPKACKHGSQPR